MKRIFKYISVIAGVALVAASCNVNEIPVFDESDAFVAFDNTTMSVSEAAGTIKVPLTLASVAGIETTAAYIAEDGTASASENYSLVDPTGIISFDADNRTAYIEINITNLEGEFTGDLKFTLTLTNTGSVDAGASSSCTITIEDLDHPLSFMLGTYTVNAESYWDGDIQFEMVITKDPEDVTLVYFSNIANVGLDSGTDGTDGYYGTVSDDYTELYIPIGQVHPLYSTSYGDGNIYLYGITSDLYYYTDGTMTVQISQSETGVTTLTFPEDDYAPGISAGDYGFYEILLPGYSAVLK